MPFAVRTAALLLAISALAAVAGGCGSDQAASGFCGDIRKGRSAFDSFDEADAPRALAEFRRVVAKAPAAVAPDLKIVTAELTLLYRDPKKFVEDTAAAKRYTEALGRVDQYLHETCGVEIPAAKK